MQQEELIKYRIFYKQQSTDLDRAAAKITTKGSALIQTIKHAKSEKRYKLATLIVGILAIIVSGTFAWLNFSSNQENKQLQIKIDDQQKQISEYSVLIDQYKRQTKNAASLPVDNTPKLKANTELIERQ